MSTSKGSRTGLTLSSGPVGKNSNRSLSRIDIPLVPSRSAQHIIASPNPDNEDADLASYLNDDVLQSAGPDGSMMRDVGLHSDRGDRDDPLGISADMEMDMGIGLGMGGMGMDMDLDAGLTWGDGSKGSPDLSAPSPDGFLSDPHFSMPFSPSIPSTHQNTVNSPYMETHPSNHPDQPQHSTFNPSLSYLPSFPSSPSATISMPMSMPGHSFFPSGQGVAPHQMHSHTSGFSPQTLPTTFANDLTSFSFLGSKGALGATPAGFEHATIPGAFLQQPLQGGQGSVLDGLGQGSWPGLPPLAMKTDNGLSMTLGMGPAPIVPTSTGKGASSTKNSKRRTSTSSSSTKVSFGTPAPMSNLSISEIKEVEEDAVEEEGTGEKRPSKRQRCESEAVSVAGSTGSSISSFDGFGSINGSSFLSNSMEGLMAMSALGDGDIPTVKIEEEDGSASMAGGDGDDLTLKGKKRKPFKPWNVSPASSHLPSGSACINPETGEVELPPLDNLTKEEIRKVKNRASAQRSRTRKVEWASGLREENDKLRQEIDVLRAGLEGAAMGALGGMGMGGPPGSAADDGEKTMLKALIKTLRSELHSEKSLRQKANAEMMSLQSQLSSVKANFAMAQKAAGAGNIVALPSPDRSSEADSEIIRDFGQDQEDAERGELVMVKGGKRDVKAIKKDGKGVLMMVVLFSFALFSMPPNLRSSTFSAAFPSRLVESGPAGQASGILGRVLPFDDVLSSNRTEDTDMTCADAADIDPEADAKCPAPPGFNLIGPAAKFQRMAMSLGQGLPGMANSGMKGRKSLSLTLLKPYDKDTSEVDQKGEVEDVLEKWLGLSLFDEEGRASGTGKSEAGNGSETPTSMPGAWVVVKAMPSTLPSTPEEDLSEPVTDAFDALLSSPSSDTPLQAFKAWDGSSIEPMDLDSSLLTISAGSASLSTEKPVGHKSPFQPDLRTGAEATLAPEMTMEDLLETSRQQAGRTPSAALKHLGRRASDASTTSTISVPANSAGSASRKVPPSAALMALTSTQTSASQAKQISHLQDAERYVKLELEVDLEMELTCKAVRRRRTVGGADFGDFSGMNGFSVVGREELGRMLDGAEGFKGKRQDFLSLEV